MQVFALPEAWSSSVVQVSQMVAMFAAAEGSATTASACQQPQPDEALRHAVDELLAQSVSSIFLRGESWAAAP